MPYQYLAHKDGEREQTLKEHLCNTAHIASACLRGTGLGESAYFAGLIHDAGKYSEDFQSYLRSGDTSHKGRIIHTFQGCRMLMERFHSSTANQFEKLSCELLSFAVAAHHGLFDCIDENRKSGFQHRIRKNAPLDESPFLADIGGSERLNQLFYQADTELKCVSENIYKMSMREQSAENLNQKKWETISSECCFYMGLLGRLLLSAVMEGDRRDTAGFMDGITFPEYPDNMEPVWNRRLANLEGILSGKQADTLLNQARRTISEQCRAFAKQPGGVYRLNVPTGAGKTLSSLRFALEHAAKYNKRRIFFTAPLLSILDQNAPIIRDAVGEDPEFGEIVLEHHSNVVREKSEDDSLDRSELLTENWSAPVIVTTLVQFLNTLFSGKTSAVRRFHALCNSVIVIDEVQTVPNRMLTLFNLSVNFLSEICGTTFVLCSATQPSLESKFVPHSLLRSPPEIVPYDTALWKPFERTRICPAEGRTLEELPDFIFEEWEEVRSLLVVCNKRSQARILFQKLNSGGHVCYHLSASMCMAHRKKILDEMILALENAKNGGPKVLCVSTQVIEAGVDISFERVVRLQAGMDSVVQAAGRCNRNGECPEPAPVLVVECLGEKLGSLRDIREGKSATASLLNHFQRNPGKYQNDLASKDAIDDYYKQLYSSMPSGYQDTGVSEGRTLFDLLSVNKKYADEDCEGYGNYSLNQAFKLAGDLFQVIDKDTADAVVPYGEGAELIAELSSKGGQISGKYLRNWLERVRPYTVSLYAYERNSLENSGGLYALTDAGILVLQPGNYDKDFGVTLEGKPEDYFL